MPSIPPNPQRLPAHLYVRLTPSAAAGARISMLAISGPQESLRNLGSPGTPMGARDCFAPPPRPRTAGRQGFDVIHLKNGDRLDFRITHGVVSYFNVSGEQADPPRLQSAWRRRVPRGFLLRA